MTCPECNAEMVPLLASALGPKIGAVCPNADCRRCGWTSIVREPIVYKSESA